MTFNLQSKFYMCACALIALIPNYSIPNVSPYINHSAVYILFGPLRSAIIF